jgi:hypothetical protein
MSRFLPTLALLITALLTTSPAAAQGGWSDRISMKGDLRLRYEGIDEEFVNERKRARYRARLGLKANLYDDVDVIFSLASGADNPTSRNVTFGDSFSSDDFGLELAYVDWTISDSVTFYGGKMKNPLYIAGDTPLIWDSDLTPEGFSVVFDDGSFFGSANAFLVEERSGADDSNLYAAQAGMKFKLGNAGKLTAGLGYFGYTNTIGNEPFFDGSANGNTVDLNGNYLFDYRNTEVFAAYDMTLANLPFEISAHYTRNGEVSVEDTAFSISVNLGLAKAQGDWQAYYMYQDIEADAVIGTFNDSDFGGGGTDVSGHFLRGKYMIRDQIGVGATLFVNQVDGFQGIERDYTRFQLDLEFKFK